MSIIQVPNQAKVYWLTEEINDSFVKNELDNIERKIYDLMDEVNFNENWASNTSSLALRNKLLVEKMKQEKLRESLTNKAIKIANEKKLPLSLVDFFIGADEGATLNKLKVLEDTFNISVQKAVEQRLKGEGYNPPRNSSGDNLTLDAIQKMSQAEINQNWDQVKQLLKNK